MTISKAKQRSAIFFFFAFFCCFSASAQNLTEEERRAAFNDAIHQALKRQGEITFKEAAESDFQSVWVRYWNGRGCNIEYSRIGRTDGFFCPQSNYESDMVAKFNVGELESIEAIPKIPTIQADGTMSDFSYYEAGEVKLHFLSGFVRTRSGCRGDPAFNMPKRFKTLVIPVREDRIDYVVEAVTKLARSCSGAPSLPQLPD